MFQSHNATTHGLHNWPGDVKLVALSECLGQRTTNSCFATMVSLSSLVLVVMGLMLAQEFGLYVDKHGDPSRAFDTIEWEGNADRVALHAPYILLFDSRFIEIRHLETGRLAQIIPGSDVRCIWDGRGTTSNVAVTPGILENEDSMIQDAQVHVVMNATEPGSRPVTRAVAQHVFELLPTVPLYIPGTMTTPPPDSFGQPYLGAGSQTFMSNPSQSWSRSSYSPPHSPGRDSGSWR